MTTINTPYGVFSPEDALAELYALPSWTATQIVAVLDELWEKARDLARRASFYIVNMTNGFPKKVVMRAKAVMRLLSKPRTKNPLERRSHIEKTLREIASQAGKPALLKISFAGVVKKPDLENFLNSHCVSLGKAERTRLFRAAAINPNFSGKEIAVKISFKNPYEAWVLGDTIMKLAESVEVVESTPPPKALIDYCIIFNL
ncbi:MAG: hypothetical protein AAB610_00115 [Patescibacteria group bacterium]